MGGTDWGRARDGDVPQLGTGLGERECHRLQHHPLGIPLRGGGIAPPNPRADECGMGGTQRCVPPGTHQL